MILFVYFQSVDMLFLNFIMELNCCLAVLNKREAKQQNLEELEVLRLKPAQIKGLDI